MLERSRKAKRIHLADLRTKPHSATQLQQGTGATAPDSSPGLLLPQLALLQLPAASPAAAEAAAAGAAGGSRKLSIPAPAFIPLEPPEEMTTAAAAAAEDAAAAAAAAGVGHAGGFRAPTASSIDPELLVSQVRCWCSSSYW